MLQFTKAKVIGSAWVTVLQPTKKEAKVLKDKAVPVGTIYYIDEDLERTTVYYQVGSNPIAVQKQGISHYQADRIMELMPDCYVRGYVKSDTIFGNYEVLIHIGLINHGLYRVEEDTEEDTSEDCGFGSEEDTSEDCGSGLELCPHEEEDTSEDCSNGSELWADEEDDMEDYSEDYSDGLELCPHEKEEDTSEDCSSGLELCPHEEEDTSIKGEVNMKFINGKLDMNDCSSGLELCPHKEEDTSKDYTETINVHGVSIKNCCISFKEAMLIHEAVEDNLIDFLGDLNLERWELFDSDVDCTLSLDEQYNNMVTGFIVFGAVLSIFTFDATRSKDIYLGYMKQSYNLRKWEVQELSNLIDIGINLDSSVIEPHSYKLIDCLILFLRVVYSSVCFGSHRDLDFNAIVRKLKETDCFDRAAKFYLTMVCWGKFEPAPCINAVTTIVNFDYPKIVRDYNNYLELFEQDDMQELLTTVAEEFHLDTELLEKCEAIDIIDKDMAIYILNKWDKYKKIKFHLIPYEVRTKLQVLYHVIRKIKGVH